MPGINDAPRQLEPLLDAAKEAGATSIGGVALHLRGEVRKVFMGWLEADRPDLVPRYERLYNGRAYVPERERKRLAALVRRGKPPNPFNFGDSTPARWRPQTAKPTSDRDAADGRPTQAPLAQATLF
jgi:DNA repair photolyase